MGGGLQGPASPNKASKRYLTFKLRNLIKGGALSGAPNPVLVVYDTLASRLVGTTEWRSHKTNVDFEEVVVINYQEQKEQGLSFKVYDVGQKQMRDSDLIGQADISMDSLAESEGREVKLQLFNGSDAKKDLKLKTNRSLVIVYTIPNSATKDIIQSGFLMAKEEKTTKKKMSIKPGDKRFCVVKERELYLQETVKSYFMPDESEVKRKTSTIIDLGRASIRRTNEGPFSKWYLWTPDTRYQLSLCEDDQKGAKEVKAGHQKSNSVNGKKTAKLRRSSQVDFTFGTKRAEFDDSGLLGKWLNSIMLAIPTQVFGVPLDLAAVRSDPNKLIPKPIRIACKWLNTHATEEEGLYRIPGGQTIVRELIDKINDGETPIIPDQYSGSNLASLNVQYLRQLPENLFTDKLAPYFEDAPKAGLQEVKSLVGQLPPANYHTIQCLVKHLRIIADNYEVNEMTAAKLAMCTFSQMAGTMQFLIEHAHEVFEQEAPLRPAEEPEDVLHGIHNNLSHDHEGSTRLNNLPEARQSFSGTLVDSVDLTALAVDHTDLGGLQELYAVATVDTSRTRRKSKIRKATGVKVEHYDEY